MGDYIYAFSSSGVTVNSLSDMTQSDELLIRSQSTPSWYYEEQETTEEQSVNLMNHQKKDMKLTNHVQKALKAKLVGIKFY